MFASCLGSVGGSDFGLIGSLFMGGLVGSAAHCTGMCGPLVLGQVAALPADAGRPGRLLLPYHLGRATTYVFLAVVFSLFVNVMAVFALPLRAVAAAMLFAAAMVFLVTAVPLLAAVFPWLAAVRLPVPRRWIERGTRALMRRPSALSGYGLGLLLGFMPCGLVIAALMASSSSANPVVAALAMAAFALGTAPVLMAISCGGGWVRQRWPAPVAAVSGFMLAANSLVLLWLAARAVA